MIRRARQRVRRIFFFQAQALEATVFVLRTGIQWKTSNIFGAQSKGSERVFRQAVKMEISKAAWEGEWNL